MEFYAAEISVEGEFCVAGALDGQVDCLVRAVVDMVYHGTVFELNGRQCHGWVADEAVHSSLRDIGQHNVAGEVAPIDKAADIDFGTCIVAYVDGKFVDRVGVPFGRGGVELGQLRDIGEGEPMGYCSQSRGMESFKKVCIGDGDGFNADQVREGDVFEIFRAGKVENSNDFCVAPEACQSRRSLTIVTDAAHQAFKSFNTHVAIILLWSDYDVIGIARAVFVLGCFGRELDAAVVAAGLGCLCFKS